MINVLKNMNVLVRIPVLLTFWVLCSISFLIISFINLVRIMLGDTSVWESVVTTDRLFNKALGGDIRETLSSRAHRGSLEGIAHWCVLCKILDKIQTDHCKKSEGI